MLCFTAGVVNAAGFFAFDVLTTNVTGHAALLAHGIVLHNWKTVRLVCSWLLLFLMGAFFTSWCIGHAQHKNKKVYLYPIVLEVAILALNGSQYIVYIFFQSVHLLWYASLLHN